MSVHPLSLAQYSDQLTDALYLGLCIRDFPSQEAERHNKPEVEFATCEELILPPKLVSRQPGECCYIESSINSCRVSFTFREGDALDSALTAEFFGFLGMKAETVPILRKKPVPGYHISFLVTSDLVDQLSTGRIVAFLVSFALNAPSFLRGLKCAVNKHSRKLAAG